MDGLDETSIPLNLLASTSRRILSLNLSYNQELGGLKGISKFKDLKKVDAENCGLDDEDIDFAEMKSLVIF